MADKDETQDPEYNEKVEHEGWKDIREKPRWCTDIFFLILIIAAWFVMTIVGFCALGWIDSSEIPAGNPDRLIYPTDYLGRICGKDTNVTDKSYGYYLPDTTAVCVHKCPGSTSYTDFICRYNVQEAADNSDYDGWSYVAQYQCMYQIKTKSYVNRCFPDVDIVKVAQEAAAQASNYGVNVTAEYQTSTNLNTGWFTRFIGDMYTLLPYVFGFGLGVTVGVAFIYLYILRIKGLLFLLLWGVIIAIFVLMIIGSFLLWSLANEWANDDERNDSEVIAMRIFAYFGMAVTVIYFCVIVVLRKRIQLAIGIVKQAARALTTMPTLLFVPLIQAFGIACFLAPWVAYVLFLAASGSIVVKTNEYTYNGQTFTYSYKTFSYSDNTRWAFLYMLFCWFWTSEFIIALGQLIVALAFSLWYFTRDKSTLGPSSVKWAFSTAIFYHAGTAAFGSLIVAVVKTIRAVVHYLQKKAKKYHNKIAEYVLCMLGCLLWCLEKILKFINKNAYIITAIYGYSFCKAARKAFWLLLRNILRVSAVSIVSALLLFIGKLFIPIATTFLCYLALAYAYPSSDVTGIIAPLVFTFFLSYWIASMFLEIYGMGIETILICYIADEEMFAVQDRFAEGELMSTIQKTAQMHAALSAKVGVEPESNSPVKAQAISPGSSTPNAVAKPAEDKGPAMF